MRGFGGVGDFGGFALSVAFVGALACGGEAPVAPPAVVSAAASIAGRYGLSTVNDHALPQLIGYDGFGAVDALSGVIELTQDAQFKDILTIRRRGPGGIQVQVDTLRGKYYRVDRSLLLVPNDDGEPHFFDINDGKLTAFSGAYTIVYVR